MTSQDELTLLLNQSKLQLSINQSLLDDILHLKQLIDIQGHRITKLEAQIIKMQLDSGV